MFNWERLVFSESYHCTRWIAGTCLNLNVSSDNFYWTQATHCLILFLREFQSMTFTFDHNFLSSNHNIINA